MEKFDWRKAEKLEKIYQTNWNIRKLADINIEFCEKFGSSGILKTRLPKACFYLARLNATEELKEFFGRNDINFLLGGFETLDLAEKCVDYGLNYERLPKYMQDEIKAYFSDPRYAELFVDMMFDHEHYIQNVQPFDFSIRNIRNTEFSDELVRNVAKGIINFDVTTFYDRSKNSLVEIFFYEDAIPDVHFIIDVTIITGKRLNSIVELILKNINAKLDPHRRNILRILIGEKYEEYAENYGFDGNFISQIAEYVHDEQLLVNRSLFEIKSDLSNIVALDFLHYINRQVHE